MQIPVFEIRIFVFNLISKIPAIKTQISDFNYRYLYLKCKYLNFTLEIPLIEMQISIFEMQISLI